MRWARSNKTESCLSMTTLRATTDKKNGWAEAKNQKLRPMEISSSGKQKKQMLCTSTINLLNNCRHHTAWEKPASTRKKKWIGKQTKDGRRFTCSLSCTENDSFKNKFIAIRVGTSKLRDYGILPPQTAHVSCPLPIVCIFPPTQQTSFQVMEAVVRRELCCEWLSLVSLYAIEDLS